MRASLSLPRFSIGIARTLIVVGALGLSACAKTTIDASITEPPQIAVTTTLPTGSAADLLPRLVTEAGKLSNLIGTSGNKKAQMQLINNLWAASRGEVATNDPTVATTFDAAVDLCAKATQFNRPADADRCLRNLTTLTNSFLG